MAAARASSKIDWAKIGSSLGLRGNTATQLQAFKKRNDDARRRLQQLSELPQSVDFQHYRSVLNNKSIVDEIEGQVKNYKVQSYDVSRQLKAIDSFEAQAVKDAQDTAKLVDTELTALQSTLKNIESARPFDECTVEEIMAAEPSIEKKVEAMAKNQRWMPAGYKEKFGDLSVL